jgi:3-oxoacyl-[acyl-carrier protein] reductase
MLAIDLSRRIAVVTGGAGDLGRVIVRTLARAGADVAIHYHSQAEMARQLEEEARAMGRRAMAFRADVTVRDEVLAMRTAVERTLGVADVLVNNAVVQYAWKEILDQPEADYEGQFRSSVLHNVFMVQAFVPAMIAQGRGGRVIGINTECSMQCLPTQSAYVAGKRGLDGVLRCLAREVGAHGITVNEVAPGWMVSDRERASGNERRPEYEASVPLRRRGSDQDVANAVAFLASDLAGFITGVYLPVCGGHVMPAI